MIWSILYKRVNRAIKIDLHAVARGVAASMNGVAARFADGWKMQIRIYCNYFELLTSKFLSLVLFGLDIILTDFAVCTRPSMNAFLVAVFITVVVTELVIARSAELGAGLVEVVQVAKHPHSVRELRGVARVPQCVPPRARVDNPRKTCFFYNALYC